MRHPEAGVTVPVTTCSTVITSGSVLSWTATSRISWGRAVSGAGLFAALAALGHAVLRTVGA